MHIFIILGLKSWTKITSPAEEDAIRIELFAKQYDWTARYAGLDNELGKYDYKLTTDNNELALITSNTIDSSIAIMSKEILSLTKLLNLSKALDCFEKAIEIDSNFYIAEKYKNQLKILIN